MLHGTYYIPRIFITIKYIYTDDPGARGRKLSGQGWSLEKEPSADALLMLTRKNLFRFLVAFRDEKFTMRVPISNRN
jgi:hypothetical protein